MQVASMFNSMTSVFMTTSSFLRQEKEYIRKDFALSQKISQVSPTALRFAAMQVRSQSEHLRVRIALITGALDKIGIIPLVASTGLTVWKLNAELHAAKSLPTFVLYVVVGAIALVYLAGVTNTIVSHRLEQLADLMNFAAESREPTVIVSPSALGGPS